MKTFTLYSTLCIFILMHGIVVFSQVDILTQHNDLARTGWNNQETILNTSNVNSNSFGLLYTRAVDDQIYAQPLVVTGVNIPSKGKKNVVYVCTVNNSIYAFDADSGSVSAYWQVNFTPPGYRPPNKYDIFPSLCGGVYFDFSGNFGLVGTPVIDKASNTMYFVTKVVSTVPGVVDNHPWNGSIPRFEYGYNANGFYQYLHAIDLSTGAEKPNSPKLITASALGKGDGNSNDTIYFDPRRQFNRPGLVLSRGIVYIAYASHCDWNPCHGWLLGYNASSLQQQIVYTPTPNDGRGGIWMSGAAPAVDDLGNLYFTTGNAYDDGTHFSDDPGDVANRGESVIKLTPNAPDNTATAVSVTSFFTPHNYQNLDNYDLDFPIQVLLIPNTNTLLTGCKSSYIYLLDKNNLGGFVGSAGPDNVLQAFPVSYNTQMHASFAYFGGASSQYVYQFSENSLLQSFKVGSNSLGAPVSSSVSGPIGGSGAYMSVTSNGSDPSTGILWIAHAVNGCNGNQGLCQGILRAVRADDVTTELWNSSLNSVDSFGYFAKMSCPTVVNGKVYLNTFSNQLSVFGLTANNSRCITNVALNKTAVASSVENGSYPPGNAFDGNLSTRWSSQYSDNQWIYVDLGAEYDICSIVINWENALAQNFTVDISDDAVTWTTAQTFVGNASYFTSVTGNFRGRYVRMNGTKRGTAYGYSIYEMKVLGQLANPCTTPTSLTANNISENAATLNWQSVSGAISYNIRYKTSLVSSWVTRTTPSTTMNISALSCNTGYTFQVQAVCASGESAWASGVFTTSVCSTTCGLPTRYFSADIGDISVAGSSCLSNGIYTLKGSGTDIGGNSDQFQFAFANLNGDEEISAQVLSQDAVSPFNKIGLMMRDSASNTSRFAFIALTSGNGSVFEYRNTPGGATTTVNGPNLTAPYWLRIQKQGSQYSVYVSPSGGLNSWVQVGSTVTLGFGSSPVYVGMAITSANNAVLSTGTIGNYSESSVPLPVNLISFSGNNVDNDHVLLKWETSGEISSDYFDVERSNDGSTFENIVRVKAAGNSNINQYYSAQDEKPNNGINFYRLRQVDMDGKIYYSSIVGVNFGKDHVAPKISPNPANGFFTVISGAEPIKQITVFDASGKILKHISNDRNASSINIISDNLAAGIYVVKIATAKQVYEQKLIKN